MIIIVIRPSGANPGYKRIASLTRSHGRVMSCRSEDLERCHRSSLSGPKVIHACTFLHVFTRLQLIVRKYDRYLLPPAMRLYVTSSPGYLLISALVHFFRVAMYCASQVKKDVVRRHRGLAGQRKQSVYCPWCRDVYVVDR